MATGGAEGGVEVAEIHPPQPLVCKDSVARLRHVTEILAGPHTRRHVHVQVAQHRQVVARVVERRLSRFAKFRGDPVVLRVEIGLRRDFLVQQLVGGEG